MNSVHSYFKKNGLTWCNMDKEKKWDDPATKCTDESCIFGEIKKMSTTKKLPSRKKNDLELLHQRLSHRYIIIFLAGYSANIGGDTELKIDLDPFCTSCQISSIRKRLGLKNHLNQKHPSSEFYGHNSINNIQKFDK